MKFTIIKQIILEDHGEINIIQAEFFKTGRHWKRIITKEVHKKSNIRISVSVEYYKPGEFERLAGIRK